MKFGGSQQHGCVGERVQSVSPRGYDKKVPFAPLPGLVAGVHAHGPVQDEQGCFAGILVLGERCATAQGDDRLGQSCLGSAVKQMGASSLLSPCRQRLARADSRTSTSALILHDTP